VLVGNSLGGWVALRAYLERPEAVLGIALVASAGLVGMPTRPPKLPFGPGRSNLIETLLSSVFHDPGAVASEAREALIAGAFAPGLLTLNPEGTLASTDLARIRCPVSVLWGREDRILPVCWADRFADALPLVKRRVIDQCGHLPQLEKPGVFNPELVAFCRVFG
jgi:pimeloyl-ACP methyl ester carboxylesterase